MGRMLLLSSPLWIQKETSIDRGDYYEVHLFNYNNETECALVEDGNIITVVDNKKALEYTKYGIYKCVANKNDFLILKPSRFIDRDDSFGSSLLVAGSLAVLLLALGEA
jgi:hypothetical protein